MAGEIGLARAEAVNGQCPLDAKSGHRHAADATAYLSANARVNAVFCSHPIPQADDSASIFAIHVRRGPPMMPALFDQLGNRKYLIAREQLAFVYAASKEPDEISTFCLTMAAPWESPNDSA